jgi:hypothetical protein
MEAAVDGSTVFAEAGAAGAGCDVDSLFEPPQPTMAIANSAANERCMNLIFI